MRSTKHLAWIAILSTWGLLLGPLAAAMAAPGDAAPTDPAVVDNTGAARLRIPIEVPPGPGGFAPNLELAYSSRMGDGPFGIGWSLGIPEIRCSDRFGVPNYASCEKYELASVLLVEDPAIPNEFHTFVESFQRIRYDATNDFWTVEQPGGTKLVFGQHPGHRITQAGATARWLLQRMEDFFGNEIYFEYHTPADTGWPYLKQVFYGVGASPTGGPREVRFEYETRPDTRTSYSRGVARKLTQRLREIQVFGHGEIFKRYAFEYEAMSGAADRSRLSWVQEFGTDCTNLAVGGYSTCTGLPRQDFAYLTAPVGHDAGDDYRIPFGSYSIQPGYLRRIQFPQLIGDINGDGRPDRIELRENIGSALAPGTAHVLINTGSGFSDDEASAIAYQLSFNGLKYQQPRLEYQQLRPPNGAPGPWLDPYIFAMCSVNLTTREATLSDEIHPRGVRAATSSYADLPASGSAPAPGWLEPRPSVKLVDIDADGLADLVLSVRVSGVKRHFDCNGTQLSQPEPFASQSVAVVFRNTGSGWENDPALAANLPPFEEIIVKSSYQTEVEEPSGPSNEFSYSPCAEHSYLGFEWKWDYPIAPANMTGLCHVPINLSPQFIDFNGDGYLDLAVLEREHPDLLWTGENPIGVTPSRNDARTKVWIQKPNASPRWVRAPQHDLPLEMLQDPFGVDEFAHVKLYHDAYSELSGITCRSWLVDFWDCGPNTWTADLGVRLADVNGDGLADVVWNTVGANCMPQRFPWDPPCASPTGRSGVLLNRGGGAAPFSAWCASNPAHGAFVGGACAPDAHAASYVPPASFISIFSETGPLTWFPITTGWLTDLDGDGLVDFVSARPFSPTESWIQSPAGTTPQTRWLRDEDFDFYSDWEDFWSREIANPIGGNQILPAVGFTPGFQIFDVDGDGSADFVGDQHTRLSRSRLVDLLESVDNGRGGHITIEYSPASWQRNPTLEDVASADVQEQRPEGGDGAPWGPAPVVSRIEVSGAGFATSATAFPYAHPRYCSGARTDLGFRVVEQTRPDGAKVEEYFYQDHGRAGHTSKRLVKVAGQVMQRYEASWELVTATIPGSIAGVSVGRLVADQSANEYADGSGALLARTFLYNDDHGYNFVREIRTERPTGTLTDQRVPVPLAMPGPYVVGRIDQRTLKDGNATLRDTAFTYQDLGGNPTGPKLGSRTEFIGARGGSGAYVAVAQYRYDAYGNLTEKKFPKPGGGFRSTLLCYDGDVNAWCVGPPGHSSHSVVVASKDPAEKVTRFTPDSRSGIVVAVDSDYTDEPARRITLDPYGRPRLVYAAPAGGSEVLIAENRYPGGSGPLRIERFDYTDDSATDAIYSAEIFGPFGGTWKTITETAPNSFAGVMTFSDPVARKARTTVPLDCGQDPTCSAFSGQQQEAAREVETDALGRRVRVDTSDGFSTLTYRGVDDRWGSGRLDAVLERNPKGDLLERAVDGDRVAWVDECHGSEVCGAADTTRYTYEATGEIRTIYDARAVAGATSSFTDPNHRLSYAYDTLGRVVRIEDPDLEGTGATVSVYSDAGNLSVTTNARGQSRSFSYDVLDRLTHVDAPPGEDDYTIEYRPTEWQRAKDFSPAYERVRTYDGWGRVERTQLTVVEGDGPIIATGTFLMDFEFDVAGRPVEVTYPESTRVRYEYEGAYLKRVCDLGDAEDCSDSGVVKYVSGVEYDDLGRREITTTAAGDRTFEYDGSLPRLTKDRFDAIGSPNAYWLELNYSGYDELGNLTAMTGSSQPGDIDLDQVFSYDRRNRLASWTQQGAAHAYGFDDLGNLTNNAGSAQTFNAATRPHAIQHRANGDADYTHDADGNVTAILAASGNRYFKFDSASRMICADAVEGGCALNRVHYDVDGRRVLDDDPMAWQYLAFVDDSVSVDAGIMVAETRIEIRAFGERIAYKRSEATIRTAEVGLPFGMPPVALELLAGLAFLGLLAGLAKQGALVLVIQRPGYAGVAAVLVVVLVLGPVPGARVSRAGGGGGASFYWELADPLGTGMVMLDETGARRVHRTYSPFGVQQASVGPATWLPRHYAGHLEDGDSGLVYMQARWMDPQSGTFLSVDPLVPSVFDPQSVNAYSYARNNPASYTDPTGMCFLGFEGPCSWKAFINGRSFTVIVEYVSNTNATAAAASESSGRGSNPGGLGSLGISDVGGPGYGGGLNSGVGSGPTSRGSALQDSPFAPDAYRLTAGGGLGLVVSLDLNLDREGMFTGGSVSVGFGFGARGGAAGVAQESLTGLPTGDSPRVTFGSSLSYSPFPVSPLIGFDTRIGRGGFADASFSAGGAVGAPIFACSPCMSVNFSRSEALGFLRSLVPPEVVLYAPEEAYRWSGP